MRLGGASTYTGGTTLSGGILNLNVAQNGTTSGPMGASGTIALTGGTLQYSVNNQYDYSARFSTAANQQYNIDTNGQNVALSTSALTSVGGALNKWGLGTLTISNTGNTYSGGTTVNAGTLYVSGASLPSTGTVSVAGGGATLRTADGTARTSTIGGLNLANGANLVMDWGDQLQTTATATAPGNVALAFSGAFTSGNPYTVLSAGGGLGGATYLLRPPATRPRSPVRRPP